MSGIPHNVIRLSERRASTKPVESRISGSFCEDGLNLVVREARVDDVDQVQELYFIVYHGRYTLEFATDPAKLRAQIEDREHYLLAVAEASDHRIVGSLVFCFDPISRLAKAAGAVVLPSFRGKGLGSSLLATGLTYLTDTANLVDVVYALTRTINEAPSRLVEEAGFFKMGIFPNAVQVEDMEHLNLDVFFARNALLKRRCKPFIFPPYHEVYHIAERRLGLEPANIFSDFSPLTLEPDKTEFEILQQEEQVIQRFQELSQQKRLANSFFPFHQPNLILKSRDNSTEIFAWMVGKNKQSAILGYRTDRTDVHNLLDSAARTLHRYGAAYVELLVDAYDHRLQQQAFTARFIPSAYFPAMRLDSDGYRNDVFVVSRTFSLLDFTNTVMHGDNYYFLKAYLRRYYELYIKPILGQ